MTSDSATKQHQRKGIHTGGRKGFSHEICLSEKSPLYCHPSGGYYFLRRQPTMVFLSQTSGNRYAPGPFWMRKYRRQRRLPLPGPVAPSLIPRNGPGRVLFSAQKYVSSVCSAYEPPLHLHAAAVRLYRPLPLPFPQSFFPAA